MDCFSQVDVQVLTDPSSAMIYEQVTEISKDSLTKSAAMGRGGYLQSPGLVYREHR